MAFHPCMRAGWQRWRRHGNALTLISSSQCTRWCIDCRTDQLATFCLPLFAGAERQRTEFYQTKPPSQRPHSFHFTGTLLSFSVSFRRKNSTLDCFRVWNVARASLEKKSQLTVQAMMTTNVIILRGVWVQTVGLLFCVALTVIHSQSAAHV